MYCDFKCSINYFFNFTKENFHIFKSRLIEKSLADEVDEIESFFFLHGRLTV